VNWLGLLRLLGELFSWTTGQPRAQVSVGALTLPGGVIAQVRAVYRNGGEKMQLVNLSIGIAGEQVTLGGLGQHGCPRWLQPMEPYIWVEDLDLLFPELVTNRAVTGGPALRRAELGALYVRFQDGRRDRVVRLNRPIPRDRPAVGPGSGRRAVVGDWSICASGVA